MTDLPKLIDIYSAEKKELEEHKKKVERINTEIKQHLCDMKIDEYSSDNYTVTRTFVNTDKLDEDRLIEVIERTMPEDVAEQLVKTKKYIDLDKLEDLCYNKVIDVDVVEKCIIHKEPTIRLNIKKRKEEENVQDYDYPCEC